MQNIMTFVQFNYDAAQPLLISHVFAITIFDLHLHVQCTYMYKKSHVSNYMRYMKELKDNLKKANNLSVRYCELALGF